MRAGDLREQVTIQRVTATGQDSFGEPEETASTLATVWASVIPQRYATGIEALAQSLGREAVKTTYTIIIYWRDDVTELDRIIWKGCELDIRRVLDPDGRRTWLELMCEERP